MRTLGPCLALVSALALGAVGYGCSNAGLQPHQEGNGPALDNLLRIEAHVCTTPPPDASFPVKILFLVDTSDSMSVTDRGGIRAQAVAQVLNRYAGNPAVQFGVIAFDSELVTLTNGFTNSPDVAAITARLATADRLTDYQGVLGAAYSMLSTDIAQSSAADRARTKYVIVFFSDGTPDPQCSAETTPCGSSTCPPGQVCHVGVCAPDYLICNVAKEDWATAFNPPLDASLYPDLQAGGDYNLQSQIFQSIDDIIGLQDFYKVGEIRLHTGFLFDPMAAADPLAAPFDLGDGSAGRELLTAMAMRGGGTFTEFTSGSKITFLNLDYASIKEENALATVIVTNENALPSPMGPIVDSDGDGLDDTTEFSKMMCIGTTAKCKVGADTDGDGYSDLVEDRNRLSGFDPLDATKPAQACTARGDSDGDGLADCEEAFLGTDPRLFDSDGDRVTDLLEVKAGLDPTVNDALDDDDHDGVRNIDEIRNHTDPLVADSQSGGADYRYAYDVSDTTEEPDGSVCYDLTIHNVQMVTTGRGTKDQVGRNRIFVYVDQAPLDRPLDYGELRVACIDTRYVDGEVKAPIAGVIRLTDKQFVSPTKLKPATDCIDLTADVSPPLPDGGAGDGGDGGR